MDGEVRRPKAQIDTANISMENVKPPTAFTAYPTAVLDDTIRQSIARFTGGASPIALWTASFDWMAHLALSPGKQAALGAEAFNVWMRSAAAFAPTPKQKDAQKDDKETSDTPQVRALATAFAGLDELVDKATDLRGVSRRHQDMVRFAAHSMLEPLRPENNVLMDEDLLRRTMNERGLNLARGWWNMVRDASAQSGPLAELLGAEKSSDFKVGENLAITPGSVVYRNELFELIQYTPETESVRSEPVLIVPAWIMKYYILDLSAQNSLVRYLVSKGFTVFMMSWRNPGKEQSELGFDDYRTDGVMRAFEAIKTVMPDASVHAVGYCLGGTLMAITAAVMARNGDDRLASFSMFAAQTDFRDAGELSLFIDEDQLVWLEASMEAKGYLDTGQMASAFQWLRARDLIWGRWRRNYLLGEQDQMFDFLAWNEDATRMPKRMHSEYLRKLFLNNDFVQGRLEVDGRPVAVSDIRAPIFALGTEKDHIAPWQSVYKIHIFADTDVTFALTNGGHNTGVISEPGRPRRRHRIRTTRECDHYLGPDDWMSEAEEREGSWWPSWAEWLMEHSSDDAPAPETKRVELSSNLIARNARLSPAPGSYVFEK